MSTKKPVVLVVMDGVGFSKTGLGDAVSEANTPTLDMLLKEYPHTSLKAHGDAVGLPSDDDMGNSEVGHNALRLRTDLFSGCKACKRVYRKR